MPATLSAVFTGAPTFFVACCHTARAGGSMGYELPGYHLTAGLDSLIPYDIDDLEDWMDELDSLHQLIEDDNDCAVLEWFCLHFPKCMALVPRRRRRQFLVGVHDSHRKDYQ